jgi:hypothetical protein
MNYVLKKIVPFFLFTEILSQILCSNYDKNNPFDSKYKLGSQNSILTYHTNSPDLDDSKSYLQILGDFLNISLAQTQGKLSKTCYDTLIDILVNNKTDYMDKIYRDSSKTLNNIGGYEDCTLLGTENNKILINDFSYGVLRIKLRSSLGSLENDLGSVIMGTCFLKACNEYDYGNYSVTLKNIIEDLNFNFDEKDVSSFILERYQEQLSLPQILLFYFLPVYILLTLLFFTCFPKVPEWLFRCCFKNKVKKGKTKGFIVHDCVEKNEISEMLHSGVDNNTYESYVIESDDKSDVFENMDKILKRMKTKEEEELILNNESLNTFLKCFNFQENSDEVFTSNSSKLNNESGLLFLRGMRGIFMINYCIGLVFYVLLDSPIKIHNPDELLEVIFSNYYTFLTFCYRTCPKFLIATTGFSFSYKFLSFLEKRKERIENKYKSDIFNLPSDIPIKLERIHNKHLFHFLSKFVYKYVLFVIVFLIFKFSFIYLVSVLNPGPMLIYCKKYLILEINNFSDLVDFLLKLTFLDYFFKFDFNSLGFFWFIRNEIVIFVICTIKMFIFFKKNWRLDACFILMYIIVSLSKIIYFLSIEFFAEEKIVTTGIIYYSRHVFINSFPLFNLHYFCVGAFFGLCNYIIQKSLTIEEIEKDKKYLVIAYHFMKYIKENTKCIIVLIVISGLIVINSIIFFPIYLGPCEKNAECLEKIRLNFWMRLYFLFNVDFATIFLFILLAKYVILGSNFFSNLLRNEFWTLISRTYFSYSLLSMIFIIYIFYQSESRINIDLFNILFFSIFITCIVILFSAISFVAIEVPLKKLNLFFLNSFLRKDFRSERKESLYNY